MISSKQSLNDNIYSEFDILEDILVSAKNRDINTNKSSVSIYKLPLDIKVKFIFILLGDINKELDSLSIDETAGYYMIFKRVLSLEINDFTKSYNGFVSRSMSVSIRNMNIFSKYQESKYHRGHNEVSFIR